MAEGKGGAGALIALGLGAGLLALLTSGSKPAGARPGQFYDPANGGALIDPGGLAAWPLSPPQTFAFPGAQGGVPSGSALAVPAVGPSGTIAAASATIAAGPADGGPSIARVSQPASSQTPTSGRGPTNIRTNLPTTPILARPLVPIIPRPNIPAAFAAAAAGAADLANRIAAAERAGLFGLAAIERAQLARVAAAERAFALGTAAAERQAAADAAATAAGAALRIQAGIRRLQAQAPSAAGTAAGRITASLAPIVRALTAPGAGRTAVRSQPPIPGGARLGASLAASIRAARPAVPPTPIRRGPQVRPGGARSF